MKKIAFLSAMALCLGFTACEEFEMPNPPAQSNPQGTVLEAENVTFTQAAASQSVLDLTQLANEGTAIALADVALTEPLADGYTLAATAQFSGSESFGTTFDLKTTITDGVVTVSAKELLQAYPENVTKDPSENTIYVRYAVYAENNKTSYRIGSPDYYYAPMSITVIPAAPEFTIYQSYNLVANDKVVVELKHVGGNLFDNPNFKGVFTITEDDLVDYDWLWRIEAVGAEEGAERTIFAPSPEYPDMIEGVLETNVDGVEPEYGTFPEEGKWIMSFNAETLEYSIVEAPKAMYMIGGFCGWSWDNAAEMIRVNGHEGLYWTIRYVNANEGFKFNTEAAWNGGEFGYGVEVAESVAGEVLNDGGNAAVATAGWYIFVIDATSGSPVLSILEPNVYVFGAAAGGSWSANDAWKFQIVGDRDAEWPFVSPEVLATDGNEASCLRLCVQLPGCEWWQSEFIFYADGAIQYRADGDDQARAGNPAGKVYLNFVTGQGKVE